MVCNSDLKQKQIVIARPSICWPVEIDQAMATTLIQFYRLLSKETLHHHIESLMIKAMIKDAYAAHDGILVESFEDLMDTEVKFHPKDG